MRSKKNRPWIVVGAVIGALAAGCDSYGAQASPATEPVSAEERPIDGLALRQQMVLIQGVLSRVASDALGERAGEALDGIEELQRRLVAAKRLPPPRFGDLDEAAQATRDRAFRAMLAETLIEAARLEIAVLEDDRERLRASLAELDARRERGHAAFQPPRERRERPLAELEDRVDLSAEDRRAYVGEYEFKDVGFRVSVVERDGTLYLETFGRPAERLYAMGDHAFRIAVSAQAEIRFELGGDGSADAIILDGGGGREPQRIARVR